MRDIARQDASAACAELEAMLRSSSGYRIRRYVEEVLLGGVDHMAWASVHGRLPDKVARLAGALGRPIGDAELKSVASVAELLPMHVAVVREYCSRKALVAAVQYVRFICAARLEVAMDYVEYVGAGSMRHDDWVARRLPHFGP
ncbi:MAG: hypothetical protein IPH44_40910 [Myxococcales bacterium]|nr:hypothetical protein [Myxococcales bacterium]MBK7192405.1 hypothetical protein [Myxococcales bacterium]MBP6842378.1 hypothetical protein [Kofleriaceae bacterium]